jgi:hypothetical protein
MILYSSVIFLRGIRFFNTECLHTGNVQSCTDMGEIVHPVTTPLDARAYIEDLARLKGTFTDDFKKEAEEEAKKGRKGMLQAIESGGEIREDLAKVLKV